MVCKYTKPSLTITQQAQLLIDRGLICDDRQRLESYLSSIGYYRLSAYWQPYYSSETEQFSDNISFDKILSLYVFDRKLRLLVIEAIERIEVALRAQWSDNLSTHGGSHAYMDASFFKDHKKHIRNLSKLVTSVDDSKEDFIQHYVSKYDSPALPPIWAIVETMTFGNLSHWFENTKDVAVKKAIMKAFNMPTVDITEKVFHALTPIRNVCAHHSRLWNRKFTMVLPEIKRLRNNLISGSDAHYLYNYLVIIDVLIRAISPRSSWRKRLIDLLDTIEPINHKSMGFPKNWRIKEPWNLKIMNVPVLRFKEFSDEWQVKKLGAVGEINPRTEELPNEFIYIDLESVEKGNLLKETVVLRDEAPSRAQRVLKHSDVLFQMVRPYQKNNLFFNKYGNYVASTGYAQIRAYESPQFLYQVLNLESVITEVINRCTGTSYPAINSTDLAAISICVPTLPEQTKIANFLTAIDDKINQLSQKVDLLSQYKKGVMQQIFSQQLRFKDDDGREFDEWKKTTFSNFVTERSEISNDDLLPTYSLTIENGVTPKTERYEREHLVGDTDNAYKLVKQYDFAYNPMNLRFGAIAKYTGEGSVKVSKYYNIFYVKNTADARFFEAFIKSPDMLKFYDKMSTGSLIEKKRVHFTDFLKFKMAFPSLPEQTKIANFLTAIDDKIKQTKDQLEAMKLYKKGLLQQMFV